MAHVPQVRILAAEAGEIRFILLERIGRAVQRRVSDSALRATLVLRRGDKIRFVATAMNAPAENASLFTYVTVSPLNFPRMEIISRQVSSRPPLVSMSSTSNSASRR